MKIHSSLFLILILFSCNIDEEPISEPKNLSENNFNRKKAVLNIINSTLCEIVSIETSGLSDPTLFVYSRQVLLDSTLAQKLISKGASPQIYSIIDRNNSVKGLNIHLLSDCDNFKIMDLIPLTTEEQKNMIGGLLISQIVFDSDKKGACFVYEFEKTNKKHLGKIGYVEVIYSSDRWTISKRFEIDKGKHRLIG